MGSLERPKVRVLSNLKINPISTLGVSPTLLSKFEGYPIELFGYLENLLTLQSKVFHTDYISTRNRNFLQQGDSLFRDLDPIRSIFKENKQTSDATKTSLVTSWLDDLARLPGYANTKELMNINFDLKNKLEATRAKFSSSRLNDLLTLARTSDTQIAVADLLKGAKIRAGSYDKCHEIKYDGEGTRITKLNLNETTLLQEFNDKYSSRTDELWLGSGISSVDTISFFEKSSRPEDNQFFEGLKPIGFYSEKTVIVYPSQAELKKLKDCPFKYDSANQGRAQREFQDDFKKEPFKKLARKFLDENAYEFKTSFTFSEFQNLNAKKNPFHIVFAKTDKQGKVTFYLSDQIQDIKNS